MGKKKHDVTMIGDEFPSIHVHTTHGKRNLPDDYQGSWFVLFSHPGDFTPVCTTEFMTFERNHRRFKALNCELIGLSIDTVFSHMKWLEWVREHFGVTISFPVIADELGKVSKQLGMIAPKAGTRAVRTVYIVDHEGTVRLIMNYPAEVGRNIEEILRAVYALQTADFNKAATPADWPRNEYIGDQLILPPPTDLFAAQKRIEEANVKGYSCLDWWFCYRPFQRKDGES
ncbi:peroxiredoxin [Texcoconibacillus texcoconensis]|uniref:Peroxiredoxin n=1 Tax=Texcoconibacillus texcoconensis TaxID=1095777 RepID=A0A840QSK4_9BACI|nr:peroxiredoxin [Texcoconibacillus texcoconensis]MBB5174293.1 peroxiredoxin (alkyl hydroperoxide reductase subunit C) [Texcoconibacillus texcoconensis]